MNTLPKRLRTELTVVHGAAVHHAVLVLPVLATIPEDLKDEPEYDPTEHGDLIRIGVHRFCFGLVYLS